MAAMNDAEYRECIEYLAPQGLTAAEAAAIKEAFREAYAGVDGWHRAVRGFSVEGGLETLWPEHTLTPLPNQRTSTQ